MGYWIKEYNALSNEELINAGKKLKEVKEEVRVIYDKFFGNRGNMNPYKDINELLEQIQIAIGDKITE